MSAKAPIKKHKPSSGPFQETIQHAELPRKLTSYLLLHREPILAHFPKEYVDRTVALSGEVGTTIRSRIRTPGRGCQRGRRRRSIAVVDGQIARLGDVDRGSGARGRENTGHGGHTDNPIGKYGERKGDGKVGSQKLMNGDDVRRFTKVSIPITLRRKTKLNEWKGCLVIADGFTAARAADAAGAAAIAAQAPEGKGKDKGGPSRR